MGRSQITKSEARAFRKRWEIVNAVEKEELRNVPVDEKLGQLMILMTSAKELDWAKVLDAEANEVRDPWNKLRKVYHV